MSPSGKDPQVLIRRWKRSHSSPAPGEFQNQDVRVRIPFPARVQFLNKTQGNGIPLGKSGHSGSTVTPGSMPRAEGLALGAAAPGAEWQDHAEVILGARPVQERRHCAPTPSGTAALKGTAHERR